MGFVNAHFVAYATGMGSGAVVSAVALASVGIMSVLGAVTMGRLADNYGPRPFLGIAYLIRGLGYGVLLVANSLPVATLGVMVVGISWTSVIALTGAVSADQFGLRRLGTVYGAIFGIMPLGAASGVWAAGWIYDMTGRYDIALWISMGLGLIASVIIALPKYRRLQPLNTQAE